MIWIIIKIKYPNLNLRRRSKPRSKMARMPTSTRQTWTTRIRKVRPPSAPAIWINSIKNSSLPTSTISCKQTCCLSTNRRRHYRMNYLTLIKNVSNKLNRNSTFQDANRHLSKVIPFIIKRHPPIAQITNFAFLNNSFLK